VAQHDGAFGEPEPAQVHDVLGGVGLDDADPDLPGEAAELVGHEDRDGQDQHRDGEPGQPDGPRRGGGQPAELQREQRDEQ